MIILRLCRYCLVFIRCQWKFLRYRDVFIMHTFVYCFNSIRKYSPDTGAWVVHFDTYNAQKGWEPYFAHHFIYLHKACRLFTCIPEGGRLFTAALLWFFHTTHFTLQGNNTTTQSMRHDRNTYERSCEKLSIGCALMLIGGRRSRRVATDDRRRLRKDARTTAGGESVTIKSLSAPLNMGGKYDGLLPN